MKNKVLKLILLGLDIAVTIFLFVISVLMLATMPEMPTQIDPTTFIGWFQDQPIRFLLIVVLPLVLLLAVNVFILVKFIKSGKEKKLADLSAEQKEALRKELLNDLAKEDKKEE